MWQKGIKLPPLCFAAQNIGEVSRSDGGVNSYSQKVYEIFSTPLLRDCCFFGVSPIALQHNGGGQTQSIYSLKNALEGY